MAKKLESLNEPEMSASQQTSMSRLKTKLIHYYSQPIRLAFKEFRDGAIYFAVGLISVLFINKMMPASIYQEVAILCALILTGIGFTKAMLAQSRLLLSRIVQFWRKNK